MAHELTEEDVQKAMTLTRDRITFADSLASGLGLRTGKKRATWTLRFTRPAPETRRVIGSPPEISLETARVIARRAYAEHRQNAPVSDEWFMALYDELGINVQTETSVEPRKPTAAVGVRHDFEPASLAEIGRLIAVCRAGIMHSTMSRVLEFIALTGLDRRDVAGMERANVNGRQYWDDAFVSIQLTDRLREIVNRTSGEFVFPPIRRAGVGKRAFISENSLTAALFDVQGPAPNAIRARMRISLRRMADRDVNRLPFRQVTHDFDDGTPPEVWQEIHRDVLQAWERLLTPHIEHATKTVDFEALRKSRLHAHKV
ncbi:Arm DNA-binding domain-containing protein [Aureimonas sp. SK2]|uniref:Arm DNA-binding domain-containing protein n=1 Tax=Aureimonas sp. SK2 TaxID=3015992 RepID=UPI002443B3C6|nr:Arm DNA-binding domain-containing protein [Aureimonas sp. SK2]